MEVSQKKKYTSLNTLKGLACIGVIIMHCSFPGVAGKLINYIFKFNVPIFFMISGFFLYSQSVIEERAKICRQIPKILKLLSFSFAFYGIIFFFRDCIFCDSMTWQLWLMKYFPLSQIPRKLVFGNFFNGTLWYLYSLLWAYFVLLILATKNWIKKAIWFSPLLLFAHIILRIYCKKQNFGWYDSSYFCSFLLYAIPFMLLGYFCALNQKKIETTINDKIILIIGLGGLISQFIEYSIHKQSTLLFGQIVYSLCLFLWAIRNPSKTLWRSINYIGEKLSMPIYIVHFAIIMLTSWICTTVYLPSWIMPLFAILLSICAAQLWIFLISSISYHKRNKHCKNLN